MGLLSSSIYYSNISTTTEGNGNLYDCTSIHSSEDQMGRDPLSARIV